MDLARFVSSTLQRAGGLAEDRGADLVYAVLPVPVAAGLELPEEARLRLRGAPGPRETQVGYGSGVLSQICALAEGAGRRYRVELGAAPPRTERVARETSELLTFQNAVGRLESLDEAVLEYLVFDFRYAAVSEDSHEGLAAVAIGTDGGSSPGLADALPGHLGAHPESRRGWSGADATDPRAFLEAAGALALRLVQAETRSFLARLERRLERDGRRIEEYYAALRREVEQRGTRGRETPQLVAEKLEAIEVEERRRRQDLRRRYTVTLRIEPLGVLAVRVPGLRARIRIQRRKRERHAHLGWNPIARQLDRWLCAACGAEAAAPHVCDEMHLLCPACSPECPGCGRPSCPACRSGPCACGRSPSRNQAPNPRAASLRN